jgi:hypothetical protein
MSGQRDPLEGCRARIERAKEHFHNLSSEYSAFMELEPYGVTSYENPPPGDHIYLARVSREPPTRWGVIAGEIVHHLRAALDHLAWQLVLEGGGTPKTGAGGTGFPISRTAKEFKANGRRKVEGAREDTLASIENIQPYQGRDSADGHLLWVLHQLDIRDKHQVLNLAVGIVKSGYVKYTDPAGKGDGSEFTIGDPNPISPLKDGTEILRHPLGEGTPEMNVQGQLNFDIAFEQGGPAEGEPLLSTLKVLIDLTDQMITWFRPHFRQGAS